MWGGVGVPITAIVVLQGRNSYCCVHTNTHRHKQKSGWNVLYCYSGCGIYGDAGDGTFRWVSWTHRRHTH